MTMSFKWAHFPKDIIFTGVRWYVVYPQARAMSKDSCLSAGSTSITPPSTGESSSIARNWRQRSTRANGLSGLASSSTRRSFG
jgi:hypothetical protein